MLFSIDLPDNLEIQEVRVILKEKNSRNPPISLRSREGEEILIDPNRGQSSVPDLVDPYGVIWTWTPGGWIPKSLTCKDCGSCCRSGCED